MSFNTSSNDSEQMSEGSGFNTGSNLSAGVNIGQGTSSGFNRSSSGNTSDQSSQQNVWGAQAPFLQDKYKQAQNMYQQQQPLLAAEQQYGSDYTRRAQDTAMRGWQNQMADSTVNSYTNKMTDSVARDAQSAQDQMLGSMDARAAASGMSGGARHGQAIGTGMTGINDAMMREQANIGFQAEEAQRARQMQALGMSNQMAELGNAGFNPLNAQWSGLNNYSNIVGDPTLLNSSRANTNQWSESFGANESADSNLGFNIGVGQNYGEQANMSSGDASGGGFGIGIGGS